MATSAFTRRQTAGDCVRAVLGALGHTTIPGDIFGVVDNNAVLMRTLLTRTGQKLLSRGEWQFLNRDFTLVTAPGDTQYDLPADFDRFVPDSSWNRTTRLPAIGSLTEQEWQMLKARQLEGTTFTMLYRIANDKVELYNTPSTVQTLVLPYVGRGWIRRADDSLADNVAADDDLCMYDTQLIQAALRLEWDTEKKFDTSASAQAFNNALSAAKAKDSPGRTLTLNQGAAYPYLGVINMPDTGYGS